MIIDNILGDPAPSVSDVSLAPTEDLGVADDFSNEYQDAESDPPAPFDIHAGSTAKQLALEDDEEGVDELSEEDPESSQPNPSQYRRSERVVQLSQPRGGDAILPDLVEGNNTAAANQHLLQTQLPGSALPLRPASAYGARDPMLVDQQHWKVKPEGRPISISSTPFSECSGASNFTFYRAFSMLRDESDPDYLEDGSAVVTFTVGDTALINWERNDPKEEQSQKDQAVFRIMAIFYNKDDKLMYIIPQWGRSWSDVLTPYSPEDSVEPDDALRGSKEIFWEAEEPLQGSWPNHGSKNPLVERGLGASEYAHIITRSCTVRHRDEFSSEEELNEYLSQPNTYFYRYSLPHAGPLRFEELPCPTNATNSTSSNAAGASTSATTEKKRLSGPLRMVDTFCGSGAVSCASIEIGWEISIGVESYIKSFETYARNCPDGAERLYKVQDFLRDVKKGTDPTVPKKGEVEWLHLSPPCQSLCSQNAHKGIDRYTQELIPLLNCIRELIMELEPKFITVEEVPRFIYAEMPKVQYTKRKKPGSAAGATGVVAASNPAAAAGSGGGSGAAPNNAAALNNEFNVEDELEVELDDAEAAEAEEITDSKERVGVRAWLHLVPALLTSNWQVDMRVLNSGHYGCPQERPRLFLFAALRGYELPSPPPPMYHSKLNHVGFKRDPNLATIKDWGSMTVHSDPSLPPAVTALEAIDDLPRLPRKAHADASQELEQKWSGRYSFRNPKHISRFSQYIRQRAPNHVFDHEGPNNSRGFLVDANKPFGTIIGQDDNWSRSRHYSADRPLTVLERRRGQSFPDWMFIEGSVSEKMKIVGNAVPFLLARAVAASVMIAATGNPSSAPPLPNLKGWTDEHGNEAPPPPQSEYLNPITRPTVARKRKINPITANVNGTQEEIEEELSLEEEEQEEEEGEESEIEEEEDADKHIERKKPLPSRRFGPVSPQDRIEVRSFAGKKMKTPIKMQRISTFFATSPGAASPAENITRENTAELEEEALPPSQQQQRQQRESGEEEQQSKGDADLEKTETVGGDTEIEEEEEDATADDVSIKEEEAAVDVNMFDGPVEGFGFEYGAQDNNGGGDGDDEPSSEQSSGLMHYPEVIDLTIDTDIDE